MRERRGWTRTNLAARSGLGRMVVSRVERGLTNPDLDVLQRIGLAMGRTVVVTYGRDLLDGPADAGHLAMQELVLRLAAGAGLDAMLELPTRPAEPWRSIDVCLASRAHGLIVIVECWNSIGDIGAAFRSTDRKRAEIDALLAARGEPDHRIATVWVVRATARNRRLISTFPNVFATRFPASSRQWVQALTTGAPPPGIGPRLVRCRGNPALRVAAGSDEPRATLATSRQGPRGVTPGRPRSERGMVRAARVRRRECRSRAVREAPDSAPREGAGRTDPR